MSRPDRPEGFYELRRIVAANIRNLRQWRGWTLHQVACGLAPYLGQMGASTISAWEHSRHDGAKGFTIEELYALCCLFSVRFADLLMPPERLDMPPIDRYYAPSSSVFSERDSERLRIAWGTYYDTQGVR